MDEWSWTEHEVRKMKQSKLKRSRRCKRCNRDVYGDAEKLKDHARDHRFAKQLYERSGLVVPNTGIVIAQR